MGAWVSSILGFAGAPEPSPWLPARLGRLPRARWSVPASQLRMRGSAAGDQGKGEGGNAVDQKDRDDAWASFVMAMSSTRWVRMQERMTHATRRTDCP